MRLHVCGTLAECVVLSYRTPASSVEHLLPAGLELVMRGPWAFWSVVLCREEEVRPEGVPAFCGIGCTMVAYRLLVQAMDTGAELHRGAHFLRSDVSSGAVRMLGRYLTDVRPERAEVAMRREGEALQWTVTGTERARGDASVVVEGEGYERPAESCFATLQDAQALLGYPALGLAVEGEELRLARVRRDEATWDERPVRVREAKLGYFGSLGQTEAVLELATRVRPTSYGWTLGEGRRLLGGGPLQHRDLPQAPRVGVSSVEGREEAQSHA